MMIQLNHFCTVIFFPDRPGLHSTGCKFIVPPPQEAGPLVFDRIGIPFSTKALGWKTQGHRTIKGKDPNSCFFYDFSSYEIRSLSLYSLCHFKRIVFFVSVKFSAVIL